MNENVFEQVFKKQEDPEKYDDEICSDDLTRRFEYDPWSVRSMAFTFTSSVVLMILSEINYSEFQGFRS